MNDELIEPNDEISKEEYEQAYKELLRKTDILHKKQVENAQLSGYTHANLERYQTAYEKLYEIAVNNPDYYPVVKSGYDIIQNMNNECDQLLSSSHHSGGEIISMAITSGSFGGTITTTAAMAGIGFTIPAIPIPNPLPGKSNATCSLALGKIDPSLAKSYDEVWETYFGTIADPHRSAMFMMRQVYDHFFELLAPEKDVRVSKYWNKKEGEKPDQIYRSERIIYAAHTYISDQTKANSFALTAKQILALYELLNEAHTRGKLDEDQASIAVVSMDEVLKTWIDFLDKKG